MPLPPASGGTCGAHRPSARSPRPQLARRVLARRRPAGRSPPRSGRRGRAMNARTCSSRSVGGAHAVAVIGIASHGMKLGFYMGYAQPGTNPLELLELAREAERLGYDSAWAAEAWGVDAITPLAWLGAQTTTIEARHGDHAVARPLAGERGDDGGDARPALGRPLPDGPRHVGPAGRRGLARAGVGEAAREDARVRRDRAHDRSGASGSSITASTTTSRCRAAPGSASR